MSDDDESSSDVHLISIRQLTRVLVRSLSLLRPEAVGRSASVRRRSSLHGTLPVTEEHPAATTLTAAVPTTCTSKTNVTSSRARAASLASFQSNHSSDSFAPSLPRRASSQHILHHLDEHKSNQERWAREAQYQASLPLAAQVVVSTPSGQVAYCSERKGPAFDLDWDIDPTCLAGIEATSRVLIDVWAMTRSQTVYSNFGKGKDRAEEEEVWKCVVSWDVELSQLQSLGPKTSVFPTFPRNTIVLQCANGEYLTAPPQTPATTDDAAPLEEEDTSEVSKHQLDRQATDARKQFARDRRVSQTVKTSVLERSMRETKMASSVALDDCFALVSAQNEVQTARAALKDAVAQVDQVVTREELQLRREISRRKMANQGLRDELQQVEERKDKAQRTITKKSQELFKRRGRLKEAQQWLDTQLASSEPLDQLKAAQARYSTLKKDLKAMRANLALFLDFIFPIDATASASSPLSFAICGLSLPNSDFPASISTALDDEVSSALGIAAQLVNIVAAYLGVALHYPITTAGSRSLVADHISSIRGLRTFPLYASGVERFRFEYGVFLLNKDVEQLLQSERILMMDLRQTLPNLKNLLLSVSSRAYQSSLYGSVNGLANSLDEGHSVDSVESEGSVRSASVTPSTSSSRSESPAPTIKARRNSAHSEKKPPKKKPPVTPVFGRKEGAHASGAEMGWVST